MSNICKHCGNLFSIKSRKTRKHIFCSSKCRERNWAQNNREKIREGQKFYRARRYAKLGRSGGEGPKELELKRWMVQLKSNPCTDCGGSFPVCCMDFDHMDGFQKSYNIGCMFAHHYSKDSIAEELKKCELVCSNCHRIRTQKRRIGNGRNRVRLIQ